jgi:hypothetical protein
MTEQKFCVNCGQGADALDRFCGMCGAPLRRSEHAPVTQTVALPVDTATHQPPPPHTYQSTPPVTAARGPGSSGGALVRWSGIDWTVAGLAIIVGVALLALPWFKFTTITAVEGHDGWIGVVGVVAAAIVTASVAFGQGTPGSRALGWLASVAAVASVALTYCLPQLEFGSELQFSSAILQAYGTGFWLALASAVALVLLSTARLSKRQPS